MVLRPGVPEYHYFSTYFYYTPAVAFSITGYSAHLDNDNDYYEANILCELLACLSVCLSDCLSVYTIPQR